MMEGKRLRVLIAENHPDLSEVMSHLINAEPDMHCVGRIASAQEVLSSARSSSADALVLDLTLQGGSGLQLIDELASQLPELRIVVFSGLAHSEEAARECKRRGAAEFVTKGCDFNVLLGALRKTV
jgi:two-component system, NarL family, invasion response regulator UvrY